MFFVTLFYLFLFCPFNLLFFYFLFVCLFLCSLLFSVNPPFLFLSLTFSLSPLNAFPLQFFSCLFYPPQIIIFFNIIQYCIVLEKLQNKLHVLGKPNTQEYCKPNTNTQYNRSGLVRLHQEQLYVLYALKIRER